MDKLLKLEKYQLLHNSIYWCGMIGIFILGFFTADTYVTEVMGPTEEIASSLADILMEWCMILRFFLSSCRLYLH